MRDASGGPPPTTRSALSLRHHLAHVHNSRHPSPATAPTTATTSAAIPLGSSSLFPLSRSISHEAPAASLSLTFETLWFQTSPSLPKISLAFSEANQLPLFHPPFSLLRVPPACQPPHCRAPTCKFRKRCRQKRWEREKGACDDEDGVRLSENLQSDMLPLFSIFFVLSPFPSPTRSCVHFPAFSLVRLLAACRSVSLLILSPSGEKKTNKQRQTRFLRPAFSTLQPMRSFWSCPACRHLSLALFPSYFPPSLLAHCWETWNHTHFSSCCPFPGRGPSLLY